MIGLATRSEIYDPHETDRMRELEGAPLASFKARGASFLEFGFGFVQYFIHPNRRTVHDRIAETIVIREPGDAKP